MALKISREQFSEINQFLSELSESELVLKYDGDREKNKYTVILRNKKQTIRRETDFPYEALVELVETIEPTYNLFVEFFLKELFNFAVLRYGSDSIVLISLRKGYVWIQIVSNKKTVFTNEGDAEMVYKSLYEE